MLLQDAFRKLRTQWFYKHLYSEAQERVSEDENSAHRRHRTRYREDCNKQMKKKYDEQTEQIINGKDVSMACTVEYCALGVGSYIKQERLI